MNDTAIKNFAIWARRQLMDDVCQQMSRWAIDAKASVPADAQTLGEQILSAEQRRQRAELLALCARMGEEALVERASYTWFNRFLAIRFMELHDYLPCGMRMLSAEDGSFHPQVLSEALHVEIDGADRARIVELVQAGDEEALFRYLFLAQVNELASCMPSVFERVGGAMELLLPQGLLRKGSVLERMVADIPEDDWREGVQIVGWMYQYYVAERKDEVFASFKKGKKGKKAEADAIAPATQLFTPDWIVRCLTENSLGRLWMEAHPHSYLAQQVPYYIADEPVDHSVILSGAPEGRGVEESPLSPESITVCDPACGSGHILVYAFDLLAAMYEDMGYARRQIPQMILRQNLTGYEIDPRAAALASFALTMKAMEWDGRFLRRGVQPRIQVLEPIELAEGDLALAPQLAGRKRLLDAMAHLGECGSLFVPEDGDLSAIDDALAALPEGDLFTAATRVKLQAMREACATLSQRSDVVVANPPYMGSKNMNKWLGAWVKKEYPDSKSDLCTCFIERDFAFAKPTGYSANVTMQSWMFLGSFEKLREKIIAEHGIASMAHIGARGFDSIGGEVVSTTATVFTASKDGHASNKGSYVRLVDEAGEEAKCNALVEAIQNPTCGWFYRADATTFNQIPGTPIAYWASQAMLDAFEGGKSLSAVCPVKKGLDTGDNDRFLRLWYEVPASSFGRHYASGATFANGGMKWAPHDKGGDYRRWYGNNDWVINWEDNGRELHFSLANLRSERFYFNRAITWSSLSSGFISFRLSDQGAISNTAGSSLYPSSSDVGVLLGLLNSSVSQHVLDFIAPTLNYSAGPVGDIPILRTVDDAIAADVSEKCVALSKLDYDSFETSWDFGRHPLV